MRGLIPATELDQISDNIGLPPFAFVLAFYQTDSVGSAGRRHLDFIEATAPSDRRLSATRFAEWSRERFSQRAGLFPGGRYRQPGAELRALGADRRADLRAESQGRTTMSRAACRPRCKRIPGLTDVRDRADARLSDDAGQCRPGQGARTRRRSTVGRKLDLLTSLATNHLLLPSYWLDPSNGVNYTRARTSAAAYARFGAGAGQHAADTVESSTELRRRRNCSLTWRRCAQEVEPAVVNHYNVQRVIDVDSGVEGRDLGSASAAVQKAIDGLGQLPLGMRITIRGQSQAMYESFSRARTRHRARDHPGLSADGRELPVVDGAAGHHDGGAGSTGRRALDAGADAARRSMSSR